MSMIVSPDKMVHHLAGNLGFCDPAVRDEELVQRIEKCALDKGIHFHAEVKTISEIGQRAVTVHTRSKSPCESKPSEPNRQFSRIVCAVLGSNQPEDRTALNEVLGRYNIQFEIMINTGACPHVKLVPIYYK